MSNSFKGTANPLIDKVCQVYKCRDLDASRYLLATSIHVPNAEYSNLQTQELYKLLSQTGLAIVSQYLRGTTHDWETLADAIIICKVQVDSHDLLGIFSDSQIQAIHNKLDGWLAC